MAIMNAMKLASPNSLLVSNLPVEATEAIYPLFTDPPRLWPPFRLPFTLLSKPVVPLYSSVLTMIKLPLLLETSPTFL
jgi:hypothetical protein